MNKLRPALASLLLAALLPLAFAQTPAAPAAAPATPPKKVDASAPIIKADAAGVPNAGFVKAHESFLARGKSGPIGVLFLGDSITAGWTKAPHIWEAYYGKLQPANFGIGGDQTQHVIWRIANGELDGITPKVTVLMLGTNNSAGHTAEEIVAADKKIVDLIRSKTGSKVLLLAIFPRGARKDKDGVITETAIADATKRTAVI
ncbi:MAG: GDSL-type esterase/lipase family protein, partial [Verrucomicrobia bacterium]|nr:GDSL-type esterase/lipase family protein [Verrucomicrobiota bacterium]